MLKLIDAFGVPISLKHHDQTTFKSTIGGLTTICLYSLCFLYGIFILYQWQSNIILPKYSNYTRTLNSGNITLDENFFAFRFNNVSSSVSASNRNNCIILPMLIPMLNNNRSKPILVFEGDQNLTYLPQLPMTVPGDPNGAQFYYLALIPCTNAFQVLGNYTCASDQVIQDFLASPPLTIETQVQINQYNPSSQKNEVVKKITLIVFQTQTLLYSTLLFQTTNQQVDTGLVFQGFSYKQYVSAFTLTNQQVLPSYIQRFLNFQSCGLFLLGLDQIQNQATIVYPKLSEILAMIGSISATILVVGQIILIFNKYLLGEEIENLLVHIIYEDQFKNITIKYDIFQKIKDVFYRNQAIDKVRFAEKYKEIKDNVCKRLNYVEIIKEIDRINRHLKINEDLQQIHFEDYLIQQADTPKVQQVYPLKLSSPQEPISNQLIIVSKDEQAENLQQGHIR